MRQSSTMDSITQSILKRSGEEEGENDSYIAMFLSFFA